MKLTMKNYYFKSCCSKGLGLPKRLTQSWRLQQHYSIHRRHDKVWPLSEELESIPCWLSIHLLSGSKTSTASKIASVQRATHMFTQEPAPVATEIDSISVWCHRIFRSCMTAWYYPSIKVASNWDQKSAIEPPSARVLILLCLRDYNLKEIGETLLNGDLRERRTCWKH